MRLLLYSLIFFALIHSSSPLFSQSAHKESLRFTSLNQESAEHLEITRERIFEGQALYGFMNGGSELFLEYGFLQLLEQRFIYQGIPFIAEYYLMDTPQNAYGIYSVHTFRCRRIDERFPVECLTPGLLQLYHGYLYLCLKCIDKSLDAQPLLDTLAELILCKNPVSMIDNTPSPTLHSGALYYICGDLGLSAVHIGWAQLFAPYANYSMWLQIDSETQEVSAQVRFASTDDLESFCIKNENQLYIRKLGETEMKIVAPKN